MEIAHRSEDGITIASLRGRFDAPAAPEAELVFRQLLQEGVTRIVVDLSGVEYISSGGIRVVVMLTKALEKTHGALALSGLNPFVRQVFDITNLAKRYQIYSSAQEAATALRSSG